MIERILPKYTVDFHTHYDLSSSESAFRVVDAASRNNVVAVAIFGKSEMQREFDDVITYGKERGVKVYGGVEYCAFAGDVQIDLIGIGLNPLSDMVEEWLSLKAGKKINAQVAEMQKGLLESMGFSFTDLTEEFQIKLDRLMEGEITDKAINFCRIISYSDNLNNKEIVNKLKNENSEDWQRIQKVYGVIPKFHNTLELDAKFLWVMCFSEGKPGAFRVQRQSNDVIERIHKAGGVAIYSPEGKFNKEVWEQLQSESIDGIMGWHATRLGIHEDRESDGEVIDLSKEVIVNSRRQGLLVLGGSDYSESLNHWQIGIGSGQMFISPRRLNELERRLETVKEKA